MIVCISIVRIANAWKVNEGGNCENLLQSTLQFTLIGYPCELSYTHVPKLHYLCNTKIHVAWASQCQQASPFHSTVAHQQLQAPKLCHRNYRNHIATIRAMNLHRSRACQLSRQSTSNPRLGCSSDAETKMPCKQIVAISHAQLK